MQNLPGSGPEIGVLSQAQTGLSYFLGSWTRGDGGEGGGGRKEGREAYTGTGPDPLSGTGTALRVKN
jgi:hypothetical protein